MEFKTEIVGHSCMIELTLDQMHKLLDTEDEDFEKVWRDTPDASQIDYNGMFGPYVFFTCDVGNCEKAKKQMNRALKRILR